MNVIYLGLMFDEVALEVARTKSKAGLQMAVHNFQKNLCNGLEKQENISLHIINVLPVGSFPLNYKDIRIKDVVWGKKNNRIGYLNLPGIKKKIQKDKLIRTMESLLEEGENHILIYSLYMPFISAASIVKERHGSVKICLIQTDDIAGRNSLKKYDTFFKIRQADKMIKISKRFACFIILTKHLKEPLEIGDRPWMVLEGICDEQQKQSDIKQNKKNICLYTGTLNEEYGMKDVADAFSEMKDATLWLCGSGDAVEYIKQMERRCDNIKFLGYKNQEEIEQLRDECDFLINPRVPTGTYTLYSFPSKTMEYIMTGKPTIMYKLEGIPDEYDEFLIYLDNSSISNVDELRKQLRAIFDSNYDKYLDMSRKGRDYLMNNKGAMKQAKRVVDFLKKV